MSVSCDYHADVSALLAAHLVVASVLIEQRYDGLNVSSLDDVEGLGALN